MSDLITVRELIDALSDYDGHLPVYISGYEGGLEDLKLENIRVVLVRRWENPSDYFGPHEQHDAGDELVKGLAIERSY